MNELVKFDSVQAEIERKRVENEEHRQAIENGIDEELRGFTDAATASAIVHRISEGGIKNLYIKY